MEIRRAYRERLYPNKEQAEKLLWTLDQCRALYNIMLRERKAAYVELGKGVNYAFQTHGLLDLKKVRPDYQEVNSQVLQNVAKRADLAFAAFFRRVKAGETAGYPKFKGKRYYSSFTNPNPLQGWKLERGGRGPFPVREPDAPRIPRSTARRHLKATYGKLVLSNIGTIKVQWSRPLEGTVKTVTVRREGPEWYVTFSCVLEVDVPAQAEPCPSGQNLPVQGGTSVEVEQRAQSTRPATALDVGLEAFATFEDGSRIDNPRYYRANEETLARRQRIVSTKVEAHRAETKVGAGSSLAAEPLRNRSEELNGARRTKNLAKARAQVAKTHRKAQRRREYFHHKRAKELIARVGAIGVEALSIDNMVRRPKPKLATANGSDGPASAGAESPVQGALAAVPRSPRYGERRDAACGIPIYAPNGASAKSGLNKSINDAAWGTFLFILQYKADAAGVLFVKVDPKGTSQVCSRCHKDVPKPLSERWHLCPHCGLSMPRDQNSACEIYQRAGFGIPPALTDDRPVGPSPGSTSVAAR